MHGPLKQLLAFYRGKTCLFEPLAGNNGDTLIRMGSLLALEEFNIGRDTANTDLIIVNGSGDFSYIPDEESIESTSQVRLLRDDFRKDYLLLPSSFTRKNAEKFVEASRGRTGKTMVFARDALSYHHLSIVPGADHLEVFLDHDMAFYLSGSPWLTALKSVSRSDYFLVVERFDRERASPVPKSYSTGQRLGRLLPSPVFLAVKKFLLPRIRRKSPFLDDVRSEFRRCFPGVDPHPVMAADLSLPQNHTFEEFCQGVARASGVASTRLHVCILAAMLGKPTLAIQGGHGNKISECFKHSLHGFETVRLWQIGVE